MTAQKAKVVFATHMQAARTRKLTTYERNQLAEARQVLRSSRKPAMNAPTYREMQKQAIGVGSRVYYRTDRDKTPGTVHRVNRSSNQYWVKWDDGDYTVVRIQELRRILEGPKGKLPNPKQPGVLIYEHVDCIYATKGPGHICDAECKANGHRYYHEFKSRPKMYGLKDGSILIKK